VETKLKQQKDIKTCLKVTVLLLLPIQKGNHCYHCFPQILIFTEAREKLGKELQGI